ncbi:hypothetical protein [Candidatus Enterococcus ikei]|uniref:Uncharacterized protein n=1 Tax=Candidatus Enterococcus ikei TaxID=2815326 RepID=A0ABS3GZ29_9ENTE|nr:hypothetical protein [Enterococcus sp. DIV0869a]MBO0440521.1 hypothetical protein [Enterococcus sp. DIV0869a]
MHTILTYLIGFLDWLNGVITSLLLYLGKPLEKLVYLNSLSLPVLIILTVICVAGIGMLLYLSIESEESSTDISKNDGAGGSNGT